MSETTGTSVVVIYLVNFNEKKKGDKMKKGERRGAKNMKGAFSLMTLTSANPFDCYFSLNLKGFSLIGRKGGGEVRRKGGLG